MALTGNALIMIRGVLQVIRYVLKRLLMIIPVLLLSAIIIFTIMYFVPGDPARAILGSNATQIELAQKRAELGLNQPYYIRLGKYLYNLFIHFDMGTSYTTGRSIASEIASRFPRTFFYSLGCLVVGALVGIPLGSISAVKQNSVFDRVCIMFALLGISLPGFWVAMMLVIVFSVKLGWLPAYGIGGIRNYILPVIAGALPIIADQARMSRSSMLEVVRSDFVVTARAKGMSEGKILLRHILPNGLIPVVQMLGNDFGGALSGAIVIENVFALPGIGTYLTTGVNNRDYPVVLGVVIFLALIFSLVMLLVDVSFSFIDPRIKAQYEGQGKWLRKLRGAQNV